MLVSMEHVDNMQGCLREICKLKQVGRYRIDDTFSRGALKVSDQVSSRQLTDLQQKQWHVYIKGKRVYANMATENWLFHGVLRSGSYSLLFLY